MALLIKAASYRPESPSEKIHGMSQLIPLQGRNGFVFLLAQTKKENGDSELLLQTLSDHVHRLAESFGKDANAQHRFEQFLGALNETLAEHVREGHWQVPIEEFDAIVGIATGSQMYLSGCGELTSLFLHRKPSQRYQVYNLFRSIQTEQSLPTWEKAFAVVLDGDLHEGDVFCVTEKDLQREIQPEDLNHILAKLPPVSAVDKIRQYFPLKDALQLIVLKADLRADIQATSDELTHRSNLSVAQLTETEEETELLLEDQRPNFVALVGKVVALLVGLVRKEQPTSHLSVGTQAPQDRWKRLAKKGLTLTWKYTKRLGKTSLLHGKKLSSARGRDELVAHLKGTRGRLTHRFKKLFGRIDEVPRSTKYLVGGLVIALIVFSIGVSTLSKSKTRSAEQESYVARVEQIEDMIERAAGAIIYKDEDQARSLYGNARTLVENLPTDTEERTATAAEYLADIQVALDEISHLVTIPNPPLLGDLAELNESLKGNALIRTNDTLYAVGSDGGLYELLQSEKRFTVSVNGTGLSVVAAAAEDGAMYLLSNDGGSQVYTAGTETFDEVLTTNESLVDLVAYANRLYLLRPSTDDQEGQVLRSGRTGSTFGEPTDWISQRTADFSTAVSLAIDGTVFVLNKNGVITRFSSGSEVGWDAGTVDPPLTAATHIYTDGESAYVYVLEPDTKRIVVFEKETGDFVVQYRSESFSDLTGIVVDEADYSLYLLAGSKLYSIAASHIET